MHKKGGGSGFSNCIATTLLKILYNLSIMSFLTLAEQVDKTSSTNKVMFRNTTVRSLDYMVNMGQLIRPSRIFKHGNVWVVDVATY